MATATLSRQKQHCQLLLQNWFRAVKLALLTVLGRAGPECEILREQGPELRCLKEMGLSLPRSSPVPGTPILPCSQPLELSPQVSLTLSLPTAITSLSLPFRLFVSLVLGKQFNDLLLVIRLKWEQKQSHCLTTVWPFTHSPDGVAFYGCF